MAATHSPTVIDALLQPAGAPVGSAAQDSTGDLRQMMNEKPLPVVKEDFLKNERLDSSYTKKQAQAAVKALNGALEAEDEQQLSDCFFEGQSYWKDNLSLTYHLRTFEGTKVVAKSLLETSRLRGLSKLELIESSVQLVPATPDLVSRLVLLKYFENTKALLISNLLTAISCSGHIRPPHYAVVASCFCLSAKTIPKHIGEYGSFPRA